VFGNKETQIGHRCPVSFARERAKFWSRKLSRNKQKNGEGANEETESTRRVEDFGQAKKSLPDSVAAHSYTIPLRMGRVPRRFVLRLCNLPRPVSCLGNQGGGSGPQPLTPGFRPGPWAMLDWPLSRSSVFPLSPDTQTYVQFSPLRAAAEHRRFASFHFVKNYECDVMNSAVARRRMGWKIGRRL